MAAKPQLIFLSSIAVAAHHSSRVVSESARDNPDSTASMGYAEAKWVCEQLMTAAAQELGDSVEFKVIRVGQVTGSDKSGYWNPKEHIPQLLRASQDIGALPDLQGVSKSAYIEKENRPSC